MAKVSLQVRNIVNLGLWGQVCEYKGWNPWSLNEGRVLYDEWVEFDDTFEKEKVKNVVVEKYFLLEDVVNDKWLLF